MITKVLKRKAEWFEVTPLLLTRTGDNSHPRKYESPTKVENNLVSLTVGLPSGVVRVGSLRRGTDPCRPMGLSYTRPVSVGSVVKHYPPTRVTK